MPSASCPSCGAEIPFRTKSALYAVCGHCRSLVLRKGMNLQNLGAVGELQEDGTPLQLGTRGRYRDRRFEILGRIQLQFDAGYWNEWYAGFESGKPGWIGEAAGRYGVNFRTDPGEDLIPPFDQLKIGRHVTLAGVSYTVTNLDRARCIGGEGELPFKVESGYAAPLADLGSEERAFATLDYSENPPLLFIGEWLEFDELAFTHLRKLEGW
ncbi:MAG: DUF4178 domain-containing protein [Planctomycetes bacterium]|nr:DUF4178 domain-containing protein [Planctomycetota bacterium]